MASLSTRWMAAVALVIVALTGADAAVRAGAVQYQTVSLSTPAATALQNANNYLFLAANLSSELDLLVFPEFGLMGNFNFGTCGINPSAVMDGYCENLPKDGSTLNCGSSVEGATPLTTIACGLVAQDSNLTVSYNTCERVTTSGGSTTYYNTQVVVRGGVVLATYRKYNVWYKACFTSPSLQVKTFDVNGATFGLFTCYDIMWPHPSSDLLKLGVRRFSYSSAIPVIAKDAVKLFAWLHNSTVVNSNEQMGQSSVVVRGSSRASCGSGAGDCVAMATIH